MNTYTAICTWDETGWWAVTVDEVPGANTQSRRLDQVPGDVAEVLELLTGESPGDYNLDVVAKVAGRPGWVAHRAHELRALEGLIQTSARAAVVELRSIGMSYRDVASLAGISYQRAHQINSAVVTPEELGDVDPDTLATPIIKAASFGRTTAVDPEGGDHMFSIEVTARPPEDRQASAVKTESR